MRLVVLVFALVLVAIPVRAQAGCSTGSLDALPSLDRALPERARIVLTGSGVYADEVEHLAARSPRLVRDEDEEAVPLVVTILERGEASEASAVLAPERPLERDRSYTLELSTPDAAADGKPPLLPRFPTVYRWAERNGPNGGIRKLSWRVDGSPALPPRWIGKPTAKRGVVGQFCPRPRYVEVTTPIESPARVLAYEVVVRRAGSKRPLARSLEGPDASALAIGFLGCGYSAVLEPKVRYHAEITALGLDGTRAPAPTTVPISAPIDQANAD